MGTNGSKITFVVASAALFSAGMMAGAWVSDCAFDKASKKIEAYSDQKRKYRMDAASYNIDPDIERCGGASTAVAQKINSDIAIPLIAMNTDYMNAILDNLAFRWARKSSMVDRIRISVLRDDPTEIDTSIAFEIRAMDKRAVDKAISNSVCAAVKAEARQ